MSFRQRTLQWFFLFLGLILLVTFLVRGLAPNARTVLWALLCPPGTDIELSTGEVELEPGEMVAAYEVACVGEGVREPLSDLDLSLFETGLSLGLAVVLAAIFGWISTRREQIHPPAKISEV